MGGRLASIILIFIATSIAWMALGSSLWIRTDSSDRKIRSEVEALWGTEQHQRAPVVACEWEELVEEVSIEGDKRTSKFNTVVKSINVELASTNVRARIDMDYRRKGLLWYSAYTIDFSGEYAWVYEGGKPAKCKVFFVFPSPKGQYDGFLFESNGDPLKQFVRESGGVQYPVDAAPGQKNTLKLAYKSRGLDRWTYDFSPGETFPRPAFRGEHEFRPPVPDDSGGVSRVRDFNLRLKTGFKKIDYPAGSISPTAATETADGWDLTWTYDNLISGFKIGLEMPAKVNPGPLASQISYFAPVSLFFFFLVLFSISALRDIELHPMNYLFLAAAFFSFHLLLAYTSDHLDILPAFLLSSCVSVFLVVTYLRLVTGLRFALVEAGISQFIYLVLFSYAHFLKGYTGLAVTIMTVLTLFALMQLTGRIDWTEKFKNAAEKRKNARPFLKSAEPESGKPDPT